MKANSHVFTDRYDDKYKEKLALLLSEENLVKNAETLEENNPNKGKYSKRAVIKFCGLSGLSLLGGNEHGLNNSVAVKSFLNLIQNRKGIVKRINEQGVYLDIKILFSYPYSDFMYDLIQAEKTNQPGRSIECVLNDIENLKKTFLEIPKKITYDNLKSSTTYGHLCSSLNKLQEAVISSKPLFNNGNSPNRIIVKFTPLNILLSFLKINKEIFIDPYTYSKNKSTDPHLGLIAPILNISVACDNIFKDTDEVDALKEDKGFLMQYFSFVSHFRYLWGHPLTLYSTDATGYIKGVEHTLSDIKPPLEISYNSKALRIKKIRDIKDVDLDLWKQYCKNELQKYCSKYLRERETEVRNNKFEPIRIFIVGSWKLNEIGKYMTIISDLLHDSFSSTKTKGFRLSPVIVDINNGEKLQEKIFDNLDASQFGIVIQTTDNEKGDNRPNIPFEMGYLMGKHSYAIDKKGKKRDRVFVFKEESSKGVGDKDNTGHTSFSNIEDFTIQFFEVIKWLWDITELSSDYAITILKQIQQRISNPSNSSILGIERFKRRITKFIKEIEDWNKEYSNRIKELKS